MQKVTFNLIKKNFFIMIFAGIFALALFYVSKNSDIFQASVLSIQEKEFIQKNNRDVAYKNSNNLLDIFVSSGIQDFAKIKFYIIFEPKIINIDTNNLSGQGKFQVSDHIANSLTITISDIQGLDNNQSVLMLPFSGENKNIILAESKLYLSNGKEKSLSIGNLQKNQTHNK
ncbi:MAG: hypothetical protein WC872_04910 [Candidatus Absconditabacterales bacterium]